jgi:cytochrome c oxidase assembly protein Cox11
MTPQARTALGRRARVTMALSFAAVPFYDWFCRGRASAAHLGLTAAASPPTESS